MNNIEARKILGIPYSSANLHYQTYNPSLERTCVYIVEQSGYRLVLKLLSDTNPPPTHRAVIEKVGFENIFITDYQHSYNKPFFTYPAKNDAPHVYSGRLMITREAIVKSECNTKTIRCAGEIHGYSVMESAFPSCIGRDCLGKKVEVIFPAIDAKYDISIDAGYNVLQSDKEILKIYNKIISNETQNNMYGSSRLKLRYRYSQGSLKGYISCLKTTQDRIKVTNTIWKVNIPKTKTISEFIEIFDKLDAGTIGVFDVTLFQFICSIINNCPHRYISNLIETILKLIE